MTELGAGPALLRSVAAFRAACDETRRAGRRIGLVPTLGALHAGHAALMNEARRRGLVPAVSIFLNPTQFGTGEDFEIYPRTLERDLELCRAYGVELVFAPELAEMYPENEQTRVRVGALAERLCGPHRPGHFEGVATVVAKLFAVTGPCVAVFGRKDYQQLQIVRRLALDLLLPVEVVAHPTIRDADGVALSSRNAQLTPELRARAAALPRALSAALRAFSAGERRAGALRVPVEQALREQGFRVQYVELADPEELVLVPDGEPAPERALLAVAAFLGATRLIDNVVLGEDPPPCPEEGV